MRYSRQREMIWQAVAEKPVHPTADQVYKTVRAKDSRISLGTVYRNLNQLADAGDLLRIPVADGRDHFDCNVRRHYHLHCTSCGAFSDLSESLSESLSRVLCGISDQTGMIVNHERIQLEGLCETCAKARKAREQQENVAEISG